MFAEKHYPEILRPEELDSYLEQGWYRMGQTIFSTHFLCFGERFYSALWVRLPLNGYRFRKSLRKILRRNHRIFRTVVRKAAINREKEQLYQRYKANFPGLLAPSLRDSLLDGEEHNIYQTFEVAVYYEDKLVAASFFDLGKESVASILGMYDPEFQSHSLGFFTMLVEIQYALDKGYKFYYPGYVVPGYERFDYKLRIGEVSYYDLGTESWLPYAELDSHRIPLPRMEQRLKKLRELLADQSIFTARYYYPLFEVNLFGFWRTNFFDFPVFLHCSPSRQPDVHLVVVYDIRQDMYLLYRCSPFDDIQFYFNESYTKSFDRDKFFMELIVVDRTLESSKYPEVILEALRRQQILLSGERR